MQALFMLYGKIFCCDMSFIQTEDYQETVQAAIKFLGAIGSWCPVSSALGRNCFVSLGYFWVETALSLTSRLA